MKNLFVFIEQYVGSAREEMLFILSIISIVFGILIIINRNPIICVLFLIGLFLSVSIYLFILGLYFLSLSYILVYIGAVSILFLFILMLINIRGSELFSETFNSIILSIVIAFFFSIIINNIMPNAGYYTNYKVFHEHTKGFLDFSHPYVWYLVENTICYISFEFWDINIIEGSNIMSIGNILYAHYFFFILMTALILLLSLIGCLIITVRK